MTDCVKLTAYFGERQRADRRFVADAVLDLLAERGVANSVLLRGVTGFGGRHVLRTDASLSLSEDPPVTIAAVDRGEMVSSLADDVAALMPRGLITLERARLIRDAATEFADSDHAAVRLTIPMGRSRRVGAVPAFIAVCELLSRHGFAGATAFLGVDGTSHGRRQRARFFSRNLDVPLMVVAVGSGGQMRAALDELRPMLGETLVTAEHTQVCKLHGVLLSRPAALPAGDAGNRPLWQKLMVHTSEDTLHDGVPIHRILVRRLLASGAARGATVLRGVWGFEGDHKPRGDRLIQWGRQVPVTTVVVDSPENIARSFEVVDAATSRHGLVTCETVPALLALGGAAPLGGLELATPY